MNKKMLIIYKYFIRNKQTTINQFQILVQGLIQHESFTKLGQLQINVEETFSYNHKQSQIKILAQNLTEIAFKKYNLDLKKKFIHST